MTEDVKKSATFVLQGTVQRLRAANVKAVVDTERSVVVRIDQVLRAPEALAEISGQKITVRLADGERVQKGQQAIFYTNGWIYGENLAVQSLGHEAAGTGARKTSTKAMAAGVSDDPVQAATRHRVAVRAEAAPVVVSGRVVAVGLPAGGDTPARISEHEPLWREAVIEVEKVHKGKLGSNRLVVRFPASTDVRWHRATKFRVGYEGVFLLHPDQTSGQVGGVGPVAAGVAPSDTFTCLHSTDFIPSDRPNEIAAAVGGAAESANS